MKCLYSLLFGIFFSTLYASAYIPSTNIILEKSIATNLRSGWRIHLRTQLIGDGLENKFEEIWTVANDRSIRVKIRGISKNNTDFHRDFVYQDNRRFRVNESGDLVFLDMTSRYFERVFHFQSTEKYTNYLIQAKILEKTTEEESETVATKKENSDTDQVTPEAIDPLVKFAKKNDPLARLTRISGVITYALGRPAPAQASTPNPGIWIEQDRFHLKKIRFDDRSEVFVDEYKKFGRRWFPRSRTVKWRNHEILISTVNIEKIVIGPKTRVFLKPGSLNKILPQKSAEKTTEEPPLTLSIMNEFYQRFR